MPRNVLFVADSHIGALNLGLQKLNADCNGRFFNSDIYFIMPDVGNISRDFVISLADGRSILNPVLVKEFDQPWALPGSSVPSLLNRWTDQSPLAGTDHLVIFLWGFAEMHVFAFEREWAKFGLHGESAKDLTAPTLAIETNEDRYFLPQGMIREALIQFTAPIFKVVSYMAKRGVNVATMAGPPPEPDNDAIKAVFPTFTPAYASTRLVIYRTLLDIYREDARLNGYTFFEAPADVMDMNGFRREQYRGDGVHANAEYGAVFLKSLLHIVDGA